MAEFTLEFRPYMDDSLQGKVVLVTGAARRLHASGANLLLHYRGAEAEAAGLEAELNATRAGSAVKVKADLLAPIAPRALVSAAQERFGRLDVLVNNASTFYPTPMGAIESVHWEDLMGSNLRAPLFLAQEAAPRLRKNSGAIINVADIHAERPLKGYLVYSIAKAGLVALTRALALELAPEIRVNGVAPGAIAWPEDGQFEPAERARIVASTPLSRLGSPEEIARAVHFLACAPFVTGQILAVDGGRSLYL